MFGWFKPLYTVLETILALASSSLTIPLIIYIIWCDLMLFPSTSSNIQSFHSCVVPVTHSTAVKPHITLIGHPQSPTIQLSGPILELKIFPKKCTSFTLKNRTRCYTDQPCSN